MAKRLITANPYLTGYGTGSSFQFSAVPLAPTKDLPHDVTAEPVVAWRIWLVERPAEVSLDAQLAEQMAVAFDRGTNPFRGLFDAHLKAVGVESKWDRIMEASCGYGLHTEPAPYQTCGCGVWALKNEEALWEAVTKYEGKGRIAFGRVQMWGRWFEHERGYRAQFARPLEVSVIDGDETTVAELAAFYGCEVRAVGTPDGLVAFREKRMRNYYADYQKYQSYISGVGGLTMPTIRQSLTVGGVDLSQFVSGSSVDVTGFLPKAERTHGTPSSFLESSADWTRRYSWPSLRDRDIAWEPGWFSAREAA